MYNSESRMRSVRWFNDWKQGLHPDCSFWQSVFGVIGAGSRVEAMLQRSEGMQTGCNVKDNQPDIRCSHGSDFWGLPSQQQQLLCSKKHAAYWDADEGQYDHSPLPYEANQVIALSTICLLNAST